MFISTRDQIVRLIESTTPPFLSHALLKLRSIKRHGRTHRFQIPIDRCVHYSAFRFGRNEYNPLETYARDIQNNVLVARARWKFIDFLRHYRPHHMAAALGLNSLSRDYPMWTYPWHVQDLGNPYNAWLDSPEECPDVLTHFSNAGISSVLIEEEFLWCERVLRSIARTGYQSGDDRLTDSTFSPIRTFELRKRSGNGVYILMDGNHRVSALSALGFRKVTIEQASNDIAYEKDCENWNGVKSGYYTVEDALRIFNAYFNGNHDYRTSPDPARIVGPREWQSIYAPKRPERD